MAVSATVVKAALTVATDKRAWIFVGSVIAGTIFLVVGVIAAFFNIFSFDNSDSYTESAGYVSYVEEMRGDFQSLDDALSNLGADIDNIQVHAVFYTLYFNDDTEFTDEFYSDFAECFIERTTDENGSEVIVQADISVALDRVANVTGKMTDTITPMKVQEISNMLKYGVQIGGDDGNTYSGPTPEAYSDETFAKLMGEAQKYIGYPYVWGGSSPATSFDCSGFVCWSYTKSGVYNLPRTTAQGIYNQCAPISRSEAKPGDLVFFTKTYVTSEPVTHIGIYVGNGQMLHCGDPIKYASIDSSYWKSKFYGFGRLPLSQ